MNTLRPSTLVFVLSLLVFQFYQAVALPLLITFDGHGYVYLANIIGSPSEYSNWDTLRTPLYPLMLRAGFFIFGEGDLAIKFLNTTCFLTGLLLLLLTLRSQIPAKLALLTLLLISFFPIFIVYQHVALTECATFAGISLIMFCASNYLKASRKCLALFFIWLSIVIGFYERPTLVYLSFPVALVILMHGTFSKKTFLKKSLPGIVLIICSFAAAYPWLKITKASGREAGQIAFGMMNQALPAPEDEMMGAIRPQYEDAIQKSLQEGRLGASGIADPLVYALGDSLHAKFGKELSGKFFETIQLHPKRYLQGIKRGFGLSRKTNAFLDLIQPGERFFCCQFAL